MIFSICFKRFIRVITCNLFIFILLHFISFTNAIPYVIHITNQSSTCKRGQYRSNQNLCISCPSGTYQDKFTNSKSCLPCPAGLFFSQTGAQTKTACRRCPVDTYSEKPGSTFCKPCPLGKVAPSGVASCTFCPKGSFVPPSAFNLGPDTDICIKCPTDTYNSNINSHRCIKCPPGTSAPAGSVSINQCKPCPPGTQPSGFQAGNCLPCPIGTYHDGIITQTCTKCTIGTIATKQGLKACTPCPPGQVGFLPDLPFATSSCKSCPTGYTTFGKGASFCRKFGASCPSNYATTPDGDCISCSKDFRYDSTNFKCIPCQSGYVSQGGLIQSCTRCSQLSPQQFIDMKCNKKYPEAMPAVKGTCPPGTIFDIELPQGLCRKCPPQTYASGNQAKCIMCPYGTNQKSEGSSFCKRCSNGLVRNTEDGKDCVIPQTNCPKSNNVIETVFGDLCQKQDCPSGPAKETAIPATCFICDPGFRTIYEDETESCERCRYDEFSDGGPKCEKCPLGSIAVFNDFKTCGCRGKYSVLHGLVAGRCQKCPAGSFGKQIVGQENHVCVKCPAGTFARKIGNDEIVKCALDDECELEVCKPCPAGSFTSFEGASQCKQCPKGTFTYGVGETKCLPLSNIGPKVEPVMKDTSLAQEEIFTQESPEEVVPTDVPSDADPSPIATFA